MGLVDHYPIPPALSRADTPVFFCMHGTERLFRKIWILQRRSSNCQVQERSSKAATTSSSARNSCLRILKVSDHAYVHIITVHLPHSSGTHIPTRSTLLRESELLNPNRWLPHSGCGHASVWTFQVIKTQRRGGSLFSGRRKRGCISKLRDRFLLFALIRYLFRLTAIAFRTYSALIFGASDPSLKKQCLFTYLHLFMLFL